MYFPDGMLLICCDDGVLYKQDAGKNCNERGRPTPSNDEYCLVLQADDI
jgi:hypothetical protein